jgi:hypothetical protein
MKYLVIACGIMKEELLRFQAGGVSFIFMDQSLHGTPQKMGPLIQREINKADQQDWNFIILGYGLCSNGIGGVRAGRHPIIIPRVHDCIALFMGSPEKYLSEHKREPGTYYLTKGWIEGGKTPLGMYQEYCNRHGKEIAQWAIKEEFKHYKRIAMINIGLHFSEVHRDHAMENARFLGLRYEEIKGSLKFFEKMVRGTWGRDFIVLKPGQVVIQDFFQLIPKRVLLFPGSPS